VKKTMRAVALLLALIALAVPIPRALAVWYFPLVHHQPGDETALRAGQTLYLFHSGTEDVRRGLHPGDSLVVYRIGRSCEALSVGRVRLVAPVGETYFEAVVSEGSVKPNDLARDGSVSCLVLAAQPCDRR
jgi:hypothetical protein